MMLQFLGIQGQGLMLASLLLQVTQDYSEAVDRSGFLSAWRGLTPKCSLGVVEDFMTV